MAFRDVGEGTGEARDVDAFDRRYSHLILWNAAHEITGGYRLGMVPELLRLDGDRGLYTSRLFRFAPAFWERYGQSLELGRAVVRPERQRDFLPLLLLWKGIARFVLRHPSIRYLFGPVSMNLDVSPFTLRLLAAYFMGRHGDGELARLFRARVPFRVDARGDAVGEGFLNAVRQGLLDYRGLDRLVRAQEGRGIPILFKHYFKMGAASRLCTGTRASALWTPFCSSTCHMPRKPCCAATWAGKTRRRMRPVILVRQGQPCSVRRILEKPFPLFFPAFRRRMIALVPALFYLIPIT